MCRTICPEGARSLVSETWDLYTDPRKYGGRPGIEFRPKTVEWLLDAAMRQFSLWHAACGFFNNWQLFLRFPDEKPPRPCRISSLAHFPPLHNPSTSLHNPSTSLHNPSIMLHNPSRIWLLTPPKTTRPRSKKAALCLFMTLSAIPPVQPRKMKQAHSV